MTRQITLDSSAQCGRTEGSVMFSWDSGWTEQGTFQHAETIPQTQTQRYSKGTGREGGQGYGMGAVLPWLGCWGLGTALTAGIRGGQSPCRLLVLPRDDELFPWARPALPPDWPSPPVHTGPVWRRRMKMGVGGVVVMKKQWDVGKYVNVAGASI